MTKKVYCKECGYDYCICNTDRDWFIPYVKILRGDRI